MKVMAIHIEWPVLLTLLLIGLFMACDGHGPHKATVKETIEAYEGPIPTTTRKDLVEDLNKVVVEGQPSVSEMPFFTETRLDKLVSYPCSRCHETALPKKESQLAHWDRTLDHADSEIMSCTTCHDADQQMEQLHLLSGRNVGFDQAYQVCGQCHFEQLRDWRGGAHGKRLNGWAGQRVISNCTSCHDPHRPGFHKRFPTFSPTPPESRLMDQKIRGGSIEH